jgi:hypothetical protein
MQIPLLVSSPLHPLLLWVRFRHNVVSITDFCLNESPPSLEEMSTVVLPFGMLTICLSPQAALGSTGTASFYGDCDTGMKPTHQTLDDVDFSLAHARFLLSSSQDFHWVAFSAACNSCARRMAAAPSIRVLPSLTDSIYLTNSTLRP